MHLIYSIHEQKKLTELQKTVITEDCNYRRLSELRSRNWCFANVKLFLFETIFFRIQSSLRFGSTSILNDEENRIQKFRIGFSLKKEEDENKMKAPLMKNSFTCFRFQQTSDILIQAHFASSFHPSFTRRDIHGIVFKGSFRQAILRVICQFH